MEKSITVFTPTYNRKHTIYKCYESLLRQTSKDFTWLIIDDGSTDGTKELINEWIKENKIEIRYILQENKGMHGAHNTAHINMMTELCVCCDSDDYLSDNSIELILNNWNNIEDKSRFSGMIGIDANLEGKHLAKIPNELKETTLFDLRFKFKLRGDYKLIYRTELIKEDLYPEFAGEKYLAVGYKYFNLDVNYKLSVINDVLCYVEYLEDGGTSNKIKHYVKSPKGFSHYRKEMMKNSSLTSVKFRNAIHYVSSSTFEKNINFLSDSPAKVLTFLAIPMGIMLNIFIRLRFNFLK
ncbi:glycosyltransferase family 2 protein [Marinilactibacillus psychrotolerans]|uniref:Glycosyl transferase n=1 Tax=Marinilactibacillus psychrotolerans TaxID=191770 RepID=A0AAV3WVB4_9LACT|nr:glycosyltransferase family 2 protein [Marinilactibacillus psychrotolerans]GEL67585.1 sugar transferase [Marinilactibacillus psychrotolerans]GEQ35529.1 glycosyl transferase [Marinilactibacillus psychrotolerans]SDD08510.1 Glycosyltransferase involved in cell wall bisynthesis [Marinilactibacillus psychrotolerans]